MTDADRDEEMLYADENPDVGILSTAYEEAVNNNGVFLDQCIRNREDRRNEWPGKVGDHRKGGPEAFPWAGASDQEVHVISSRLDDHIALNMQAVDQSHTKALPVKMQSAPRASAAGAFAKWMRTSGYIPEFDTEHEKVVNHGFEKGLMISYVGWEEHTCTYKETLNIEQIAEQVPELAELIMDGDADDEIAALLIEQWPKLKPAKAKKAVRQLRQNGEAELYVSRKTLMDSHPVVKACAPDTEVFFPSYTMSPQEAPYVFWRRLYTAQQIEAKVLNEGWDREWADEMLENYRGCGVTDVRFASDYRNSGMGENADGMRDLILVTHAYQRLVDPDDGSEGIYCTTFNPYYTGEGKDAPAIAKRELLSGHRGYPFVVTRMYADSDRIYDTQAMPEKLRGAQRQVKVERDSRIDRNALATIPELTGPAGRQPSQRGPGRYIPVRRPGEYTYLETPGNIQGSVEIEAATLKMADQIAGLDLENPNTPARKQFFVTKTLKHASAVLNMAYTRFQQYGPDEIFFNVTGVPDPVTFQNVEDDAFQFTMTFDTLSTDPDTAEKKVAAMMGAMQMDVSGRIDRGKFTEFVCFAIDPAFAEHILLPADEATQKLQNDITTDFAKLAGGVAVGAQPNGAEVTLQMAQMWMQEPDVAERLQSDEAFRNRVENYLKQAQMQLMQAQNKVTGRLGTPAATFQGTNVA